MTDDQGGRSAPSFEIDVELVENIEALLESGQQGMVLNLVADLYPADLALILSHLSFQEAQQLFRWLPDESAGVVLPELDDDFRAVLLETLRPQRLTAVLDELDTDDAADVLADLPDALVRQVLPRLEDADDLQTLMAFDEESAGGIMGTEYVAVPVHWTVAEVTEEVRRNTETVETVYAIFVVDADGRLVGLVTLKRLLLSQATATMAEVMNPEPISVPTDIDQEEVARVMERYDIVTLPVVDANGRLVGRITIDDVVDVIREEAEEDIQRMSGVSGGEEPTDTIRRIVQGRLPWLIVGLVGAGLSGLVIHSFEETIEQAVVLAMFIPIVMAMAGNAGIQSSAIAVQGLASGDVWSTDLRRRMMKELAVAVINAAVLAGLLALFVLLLAQVTPVDDALALVTTAGLALVIVIILAALTGAMIPLLLHRLGIDPAIATGPFITTSNDILGILIFFVLATRIYLS